MYFQTSRKTIYYSINMHVAVYIRTFWTLMLEDKKTFVLRAVRSRTILSMFFFFSFFLFIFDVCMEMLNVCYDRFLWEGKSLLFVTKSGIKSSKICI